MKNGDLHVINDLEKMEVKLFVKKDGSLSLKTADKIPPEILKVAESIFNEIDQYLLSVESMNNVDLTLWKMVTSLLGNKNEKLNDFICNDQESLDMFFKYQGELAASGWNDAYSCWFKYENDKTLELKQEIYKRAIAYFKKIALIKRITRYNNHMSSW